MLFVRIITCVGVPCESGKGGTSCLPSRVGCSLRSIVPLQQLLQAEAVQVHCILLARSYDSATAFRCKRTCSKDLGWYFDCSNLLTRSLHML